VSKAIAFLAGLFILWALAMTALLALVVSLADAILRLRRKSAPGGHLASGRSGSRGPGSDGREGRICASERKLGEQEERR